MIPLPPISTLFPYTTLFRSHSHRQLGAGFRAVAIGWGRSGFWGGSGVLCGPAGCAGESQRRQRPHRNRRRSEEHTSELQSHHDLVCRLLLEKKKRKRKPHTK